MARTVLPIAGFVVGAAFGVPQLGFVVGSLVASAIPQEAQGPRIGETGAQTSQEGAPRAIIYGTAPVTGNVIASGPLVKREVESNEGGKGGTDVSTEHGFRTYAVRMCEGPIGGYLRWWQDDKLVYDVRPGSPMLAESAQWAANKVFYLGGEDQLPDPSLQMIFGVDEVPAHRGTAYMVAIDEDLTDRRGSIPQYRAEVAATTQTGDPILAPLQIFDWTSTSLPVHSQGDSSFFVSMGTSGLFDNLPAAISYMQTEAASFGSSYVDETGPACQYLLGFNDSVNGVFSRFPGGADLSSDPQTVSLKYSPRTADSTVFYATPGGSIVAELTGAGASGPDPAVTYFTNRAATGTYASVPTGSMNLFIVAASTPPTGEFSFSPSGFPPSDVVNANVCLPIVVERVPSAPAGYTKVVGTAKVLCDNEYRSGALYQQAQGPVLLPGDPNYSDSAFWAAAAADAITAGTMHADVATAVVVAEYCYGFETTAGLPVPLSLIVADIHDRVNFPEGKRDVSELTDLVSGLVLAGDYSAADAINTLRSLYLFDCASYDKKNHYPKRGGEVVATLTIDDLVEEPDTSKRDQAIEFPKKLHLQYQNAIGGYAPAQASSTRSSPDVRVVGETAMQVPVVLNADQAARAAEILHKVAWAEAEGEVKLSIPESFIRFVPSNCLGLALRGSVKRLRIEQIDMADGVISLTLRHDRQSAYTSNVTGIPIPEPTPPPATIVGDTVLAVLDMSPRADSEDDLHYLVAVTGGMPAWHGATVQRSLDGGATYSTAVSVNTAAVMGSLVTDLADASEFYTDTTNVIRVQLYRDTQTIESITDAQFLSEGGAFAIVRPDGSCEVLQYREADEVSAGVFDLSYLHRGQLNSGTSSHLAGALLVMLDRAVHVPAQSAWINADLTHRAPSYDQAQELAAEQTETYAGKSQTEWPVASLSLARDISDNVSGTWAPRHRFGTEDVPVASINFRGFRVTLDDGVLAPVTFDTVAEAFTYDASALGSPLTVSVSSINRITGAGPATSGSV